MAFRICPRELQFVLLYRHMEGQRYAPVYCNKAGSEFRSPRPFLLSTTLPLLHTQDLFLQDSPKSLQKAGFLLQAASAVPAGLSVNVSWFYVSQLLLSDLPGAGGSQDPFQESRDLQLSHPRVKQAGVFLLTLSDVRPSKSHYL